MKKQSSDNLSMLETPDEIEIEVCDILLNLATLIHKSEINNVNDNDDGNNLNLIKSPFSWGKKRKRSNRDSMAAAVAVVKPSSPPPPATTSFQDKVEAASSPATPLSFSPSESDDKSLRKCSKKRSREEWLEIIDGLTQSREILRGEVENVRSYYNKLKSFNMELKAIKHERLTAYVRQQLPQMGNLGMNYNQHYRISIMPPQHHQQHQQSYVVDQEFQYPSSYGVTNHVGPRGIIPDLNVSPEEAYGVDSSSQPLDQSQSQGQSVGDRKAMAAEKRMIRRMINIKKKKNDNRSR